MPTNIGTTPWSSTQRLVAFSPCEAKLHAMNKGASEDMGIRRPADDMGIALAIVIVTDCSAARGAVNQSKWHWEIASCTHSGLAVEKMRFGIKT